MEWQKKAFLLIVAVLLYNWIPMYIQILGAYEDVYSHTPGNCTFVPGIDGGSEDIHTLPDGTTFISSGLGKLYPDAKTASTMGNIFLYNLSEPDTPARALKLKGIEHEDFIPHGLSVYINDKTGLISVFVVNHHKDGDRIEKFHFNKPSMTLQHVASFYDNRLTHASDVVAMSEDSFYYTNYLYSTSRMFKTMELYMPMTWGAVFYWELGQRPRLAVRRLKQPNGIIASQDKKLIYVAHEGYQELLVYRRQDDNSLNLTTAFKLNTSANKMSLSADGRKLWVGSHAVFWKIHKQLRDPEYNAPSQVLCLRLKNGINVTKVTEVYADDGSTLKGSSSASYYEGQLLVGTVIHKLMRCDLTHHHS